MIEVVPRKLFLDDRGWLFEMARLEELGIVAKQVTASHLFSGAIKAFHKHEKQTDWVTCVLGNVKLITFEMEEGEKLPKGMTITYFGEKNPALVKIPPGTYHGYTALGGAPATIIYITDQIYDPADEFRIPWNQLGGKIWQIEHK